MHSAVHLDYLVQDLLLVAKVPISSVLVLLHLLRSPLLMKINRSSQGQAALTYLLDSEPRRNRLLFPRLLLPPSLNSVLRSIETNMEAVNNLTRGTLCQRRQLGPDSPHRTRISTTLVGSASYTHLNRFLLHLLFRYKMSMGPVK